MSDRLQWIELCHICNCRIKKGNFKCDQCWDRWEQEHGVREILPTEEEVKEFE